LQSRSETLLEINTATIIGIAKLKEFEVSSISTTIEYESRVSELIIQLAPKIIGRVVNVYYSTPHTYILKFS